MDEIKQFSIVDRIGDAIQTNVYDVNPDRRIESKRWVFSEYPNTNVKYPQCLIEFSNEDFEEEYAGNLMYEYSDGTKYFKVFSQPATASLLIHVSTLKNNVFEVPYKDSNINITNKKLNVYVTELIKSFLRKNDFKDILNYKQISNVEYTFEDGQHRWTSTITLDIEYQDLWLEEYEGDQLLQSYSLNIDVNK